MLQFIQATTFAFEDGPPGKLCRENTELDSGADANASLE
jgi:hypothetical protein